MWKRGEIAPKEQFLLFSTIFCYLLLDFHIENRDQIFTSRWAVSRDKRSWDNESLLYFSYFSLKTNEYPQCMFLWRNKKNVNIFQFKKNLPYLEQCIKVPFPVNGSWMPIKVSGPQTGKFSVENPGVSVPCPVIGINISNNY